MVAFFASGTSGSRMAYTMAMTSRANGMCAASLSALRRMASDLDSASKISGSTLMRLRSVIISSGLCESNRKGVAFMPYFDEQTRTGVHGATFVVVYFCQSVVG